MGWDRLGLEAGGLGLACFWLGYFLWDFGAWCDWCGVCGRVTVTDAREELKELSCIFRFSSSLSRYTRVYAFRGLKYTPSDRVDILPSAYR